MMKLNVFIILVFSAQYLIAQTFTEISDSPFEGVQSSSIAFADVDGDNDQDVLIIGQDSVNNPSTKLYSNDGVGNFTEVLNTSFEDLVDGSIAFADVDGDGDQDVLITGRKISFSPMAKLYFNDGVGNFTEMPNISIVGVTNGSIAFADVDGDNDQDVLITGTSAFLTRTTKLYLNDGIGNYTEMANTSFEQVDGSSIAFVDMNGDNDQDIFITGYGSSGGAIAFLYLNDGAGNYAITEVVEGVYHGSIAFADVDGDDDQDVLITGQPSLPGPLIAKLYANNGVGSLDEVLGTPFEGVSFSSIAFADVDGDNDQDILITGSGSSGRISKLYTNDGVGNFTELPDTPFKSILMGSVAFADIDGDNDQDLLISGNGVSQSSITKLYINEGLSSSVKEALSVSNIEFTLYPNPTNGQSVNVRFKSDRNTSVQLKVFDNQGRLLIQKKQTTNIGEQFFLLNISTFPKGSYSIQLDDGVRQSIKELLVY